MRQITVSGVSTPSRAARAELDADGCRRLAAAVIYAAVFDIDRGRNADAALRFLRSPRGCLFLDAVGISPDAALSALRARGGAGREQSAS